MYKKIFIQLFLLLVVVSIIFSILYFYFYNQNENNVELQDKKTNQIYVDKKEENKKKEEVPASIIENLNYLSKDSRENEYEITAKRGEMNLSNLGIIHMFDVKAIIRMKDTAPIFIESNYAIYNKQNYDTNFSDNVIINHLTHKATGNNLDLSFRNNIATMSDEIVYTNVNTILNDDRLEIDLIKKNSKIFMNNKNEKIKILMK